MVTIKDCMYTNRKPCKMNKLVMISNVNGVRWFKCDCYDNPK